MNEEYSIEEKLEEVMCENKLLQEEIKDLCKKIKVNEKSRRKMQKSLMGIIQQKEDIINNILDYIDSNKFVEQFENVGNERNVRNEILSKIERSDK